MDFRGICVVFICLIYVHVNEGAGSKCLDRSGRLKCTGKKACLNKKKELCPNNEGKGCKCRALVGCYDSYNERGCDYDKECVVKKNGKPCNNYGKKSCTCREVAPTTEPPSYGSGEGCVTMGQLGCGMHYVCMKENNGKFISGSQLCEENEYGSRKCSCQKGASFGVGVVKYGILFGTDWVQVPADKCKKCKCYPFAPPWQPLQLQCVDIPGCVSFHLAIKG